MLISDDLFFAEVAILKVWIRPFTQHESNARNIALSHASALIVCIESSITLSQQQQCTERKLYLWHKVDTSSNEIITQFTSSF